LCFFQAGSSTSNKDINLKAYYFFSKAGQLLGLQGAVIVQSELNQKRGVTLKMHQIFFRPGPH